MSDARKVRNWLAEGARALEAGDVDAALTQFEAALTADPANVDAALRIQEIWNTRGLPTRGIDVLRGVARVSKDPVIHVRLGQALLAARCAAEAAPSFQVAHDDPEQRVSAYLGEGQALLILGSASAAMAAFDIVLEDESDHLQGLIGRATALDLLGRPAEAEEAWRLVLSASPKNAEARRRVEIRGAPPSTFDDHPADTPECRLAEWGNALFLDGRHEEAIAALAPLSERKDVSSTVMITLAKVRSALGDDVGAREAIGHALGLGMSPRQLVQLAEAMALVGMTEARATFDSARRAAPEDATVLATVGHGLLKLGDAAAALPVLEASLALDPWRTDALVSRAHAFGMLGREVEARAAWRRLAEVAPDHAEVVKRAPAEAAAPASSTEKGVARIHHDLGRSMLQRGRLREAAAAFRNATEIRPDWAEPWRQLGLTQARMDEPTAALEAFTKALELDATDLESATRVADLLRAQGSLASSIAAYDRALKLDAAHLPARIGRGEVLRMLGQFAEATKEFEAALTSAPEDVVALCGLAAALNGQKRFTEARQVWARARERDSTSQFVVKGIAQCHSGLRGISALPYEDISREPQPPRAGTWGEPDPGLARYEAMDLVDRGRSYHKELNFRSAVDAFRRALELDPTCDEAALRLGMAYEDDRQYRRAIAAYRTCLEIEPRHYQAATNIGEAYRKNEQYREAMAAYDQALGMKPDYLYALAGRAECMRMLGKYDECLPWFDKALAAGGGHAFAIQGKAAALNALQRFEEALDLWNRTLEVEPTSKFALEGKAYCEAKLKSSDGAAPSSSAEDSTVSPKVAGESATPTLDEQGRDLTAAAREGRLPKVVGRDDEIRQVMKTLVRRLKANPLLLGEPGVGKTAVVEGLAQRLVSGEAPERLKGIRIVELSMGSLIAGTKYRGTFEERLREIIKEAASQPGLVLFIDEIHTLVGAGRTEGGSLDAANILKPALARGEITVIGATTHAEYRQHFESDSALERRFQPIVIEEPSESASIALLGAMAGVYETHHKVKVKEDALAACVQMAVRFFPDRRLPDKALDMLDEACAEASLSNEAFVDADVVARVISERTGVPVQRLTDSDRARMATMEAFLEDRIVGQHESVVRLSEAVRLARSGLRAPERPRGVFLFRGASGVGKTELAKAMADFLFPEGDALIRLDMSEYADRFTASRLLGAPPGYSGHGEEGQLTGPLRKKPYSVVLLDEFEKAHPDVQAVFMQLLDEGTITDADGRQVNAREAYFILTTNAGTDAKAASRMGFERGGLDARAAALEAVKPFFRPELLDRIDEVIAFHDLDQPTLESIATLHLGHLRARAADHNLALRWNDDLLQHLVNKRRSGERGARQVIRAVDTEVGEPLGRLLITRTSDRLRNVVVKIVDGSVEVDVDTPSNRAKPEAEPV